MGLMVSGQSEQIQILHRTIRTIRSVIGLSELPAAWVDVLLVVALKPALPLSRIEEESGLPSTSVQRALLALGATERLGKLGPGLIEDIADPRHGARKLYFLTAKGRTVMAEILSAMTGENVRVYDAPTVSEYLTGFDDRRADQLGGVDPKAFTPQTVMVGKRSLLRKGIQTGPYTVSFPLIRAGDWIGPLKEWVEERGGKVHLLPKIAKPQGMVIVDLPDADCQVQFHMHWFGPAHTSKIKRT